MTGVLYLTGLLYKATPGELMGERPRHYPVKLAPHMAYLLYLQISDIESINNRKNSLCKTYFDSLTGIKMIRQYYQKQYDFVRYPILFDRNVSREQIHRIKSDMKSSGIVPGEWFNDVVHPKGSLRYCYIDGSCPVGESVSDRMINLPVTIHRQLNERDLQKLRKIFTQHLEAE
jgi:dTDP-4-amino-4,6-dideoxygalactose transaminase